MSARPYIQSALSELQSALNDIQRQIKEAQAQANNEKQHLQQDIGRLEHEAQAGVAAAAQLKTDTERDTALRIAEHFHDEEDDKKGRLSQIDGDIPRILDAKNQAYNGLQNLVQQLNGFMASPDI